MNLPMTLFWRVSLHFSVQYKHTHADT